MFCRSSFDFLICTYFKWTCAGMITNFHFSQSTRNCGKQKFARERIFTLEKLAGHAYPVRYSICPSKWKNLPDNDQWLALISRPDPQWRSLLFNYNQEAFLCSYDQTFVYWLKYIKKMYIKMQKIKGGSLDILTCSHCSSLPLRSLFVDGPSNEKFLRGSVNQHVQYCSM